MTTRERREARAERLREWAGKRETKAEALHAQNEPYRGDTAFNTQPGHIPERARAIARTERAWEHSTKAASMSRRADSIERAAEGAIYSDDPDAIEALEARIEELEAKRAKIKAHNAAARKNGGEALPRYVLENLGGNINRQKKRLAQLQRDAEREAAGIRKPARVLSARYSGECIKCLTEIREGDTIHYRGRGDLTCQTCETPNQTGA